MKNSKYIVVFVVLLGQLFFNNCTKKTYTLDPAADKVAGLNGDWELYSVIEVDEISLSKGERDISEFYLGDGTVEVLKVNFNSSNKTYEIIPGDIGRNYLPSSGTWSYDDNNYPEFIYLKDDNGEITTLKLQGPTRPQDQKLKISFQRSCSIGGESVEYVGYRYEFNRK
jgi:hypothetical protein